MRLAVIGGGPAGLRAAESAAALFSSLGREATITLYEGKPSVGRKFLVAGKGGLNITKDEPAELFHTRSHTPGAPEGLWEALIAGFTPEMLRAWAAGLGVNTFTASTGRVYPESMKAAPLLRRWVARLKQNGVALAMNHRWRGWERVGSEADTAAYRLFFDTPEGSTTVEADAVVLALGGGSWPQTGSDGHWRAILSTPLAGKAPIALAPFSPANCGWEVAWDPQFLAIHEGQPLKNIIASAGEAECTGELLITRYGLEGGALYQLGPQLRAMEAPLLTLDLKPGSTPEQLVARFGAPPRRPPPDLCAQAAHRWKLSPIAASLLEKQGDALSVIHSGTAENATTAKTAIAKLATRVKAFPLPLRGPRPLEEAISTAGGICWSEIDTTLMLRQHPGIFVAGEMIDWEAPTGGYLLQGAFATGHRAGSSAARYLSSLEQ